MKTYNSILLVAIVSVVSSISFAEDLQPVVPAKPDAPIEHSENRYGKTDRPLGDFMVGPYLTLASLPRPISFGLESKYTDLLGASASYGFMPELTFSNVKVKLHGWDIRAKVYPFKGAFFAGLGFGTQTFSGTVTDSQLGATGTLTLEQNNTFIAPQVGWNWIWESGFFMGMDLGVQLSMNRSTTVTTNITDANILASDEYKKQLKDITDKADLVGKTPLPILTLIKVGFLF